MSQLFSNASRGYLPQTLSSGTTSITLTGLGNLFKTVVAPDIFKAVLQDSAGIEIVYCTAHADSSNVFTVQRGQEGTTARAFAAGSVFGQRVTAADMTALMFQYQSKTVSVNTVLDANTEYVTGSGLRVIYGITLEIPASTKLEVKPYSSSKKF